MVIMLAYSTYAKWAKRLHPPICWSHSVSCCAR